MNALQRLNCLRVPVKSDRFGVQPLLLNRDCLVKKIEFLSPLIEKLHWKNNNEVFSAYWSYLADSYKRHQQDILQRIEQNEEFLKNIEDKPPESFMKFLVPRKRRTGNELILNDAAAKKAENIIYEEFMECFNYTSIGSTVKPRKRRPESLLLTWKRERLEALDALKATKNPYDIEQIQQKVKRLEQLEERLNPTQPYPERLYRQKKKYEQVPKIPRQANRGIESLRPQKSSISRYKKKRKKYIRKLYDEVEQGEQIQKDTEITSRAKPKGKYRRKGRQDKIDKPTLKENEKEVEIVERKNIYISQPLKKHEKKPESRHTLSKTKHPSKDFKVEQLLKQPSHNENLQESKENQKSEKLLLYKREMEKYEAESNKVADHLPRSKHKAKHITKVKQQSKKNSLHSHETKKNLTKSSFSLITVPSKRKHNKKMDTSAKLKKNEKQQKQEKLKGGLEPQTEQLPPVEHDYKKDDDIEFKNFIETVSKKLKIKRSTNDIETMPKRKTNTISKVEEWQEEGKFHENYGETLKENVNSRIRERVQHSEQTPNVYKYHNFTYRKKRKTISFKRASKIIKDNPKKDSIKRARHSENTPNVQKCLNLTYKKRRKTALFRRWLRIIKDKPTKNSALLRTSSNYSLSEPKLPARLSNYISQKYLPPAPFRYSTEDTISGSVGSGNKLAGSDDAELRMPLSNFKLYSMDKDVVYHNPYEERSQYGGILRVIEEPISRSSSVASLPKTLSKTLPNTLHKTMLHTSIHRLSVKSPPLRIIRHKRLTKPNIPRSSFRVMEKDYRKNPLMLSDLVAEMKKSDSLYNLLNEIKPDVNSDKEHPEKKDEEAVPMPMHVPKPKKPKKLEAKETKETKKPPVETPKAPRAACTACRICAQLRKCPALPKHPYMEQIERQLKILDLRSYYTQMMLRNCLREKQRQGSQRLENDLNLCPF